MSTSSAGCGPGADACARKDDEGGCQTQLPLRTGAFRWGDSYGDNFLTAWGLLHKPSLLKKLAAEAIGTFYIVFVNCAAIVVNRQSGGAITHGGVAIAVGLAVMAMINTTGHISGAHFNPAVTLAFALMGRFPWKEVPSYMVMQTAGAAVAGVAVWGIIGSEGHVGATLPSGSAFQSFCVEAIITFFLMFVACAVATDNRVEGTVAGVAVGGTVGLNAMFAGPVSGASMNPARSFGPALASGAWDHFWVYIAGPFLGAAFGALSYEFIRCDADGMEKGAHGCCK